MDVLGEKLPLQLQLGIAGQDVRRLHGFARGFRDGTVHVTHPILFHVNFQLPGTGWIGQFHEDVAPADGASQQQVLNVPGGDQAVDGTGDREGIDLSLEYFSLGLQ